jgi:hypothetical protein
MMIVNIARATNASNEKGPGTTTIQIAVVPPCWMRMATVDLPQADSVSAPIMNTTNRDTTIIANGPGVMIPDRTAIGKAAIVHEAPMSGLDTNPGLATLIAPRVQDYASATS